MKEMKTLMEVKPYLTGSKRKSIFDTRIGVLLPLALVFLSFNTQALAQVTYTTCPVTEPSGYAQSQTMPVAKGVGLHETIVGGACGSPLTVTLPPGAVPVTAYAYVEYSTGNTTANTTAISMSPGGTLSAGVALWAVVLNHGPLGGNWYSARYGVS